MTYTPTLADTPQTNTGAYIPTLADTPNDSDISAKKGLLSQIANSIPITAINNLGGGLATGLYDVGKAVLNAPTELINNRDLVNSNLNPPFSDPNSMSFDAGQILGYGAGAIPVAMNAETLLPEAATAAMSPLAKNIMKGIITGTLITPGDRTNRTLGATIGGLFPLAGKGIGSIKNAFNKDAPTLNYLQNLLGSANPSNLNSMIAQGIRETFPKVNEINLSNYGTLKQAANQAGFLDNVTPTTSQVWMGAQKPLSIEATNSKDMLDQLLNNPNFTDSQLKNSIQQFKSNPSFANAHQLQSDLGAVGSQLKNAHTSTVADKALGRNILSTRQNLINDIKNSFSKSGNDNLANQYSDASNYYLKNIVPYLSNSFLRKTINPDLYGKTPVNLSSQILSDNPNMKNVLNHLEQYSPQTNDFLLTQYLNKGNPLKIDASGKPVLKADNFFKNYNAIKSIVEDPTNNTNLNQNLSVILNPERKEIYDNLLSQYNKNASKLPALKSLGKKILEYGALGTGIGAGSKIFSDMSLPFMQWMGGNQ